MRNYEDVMSMEDVINDAFNFDSDIDFDIVEEDLATEATVKGAAKTAFAWVASVIRRVIDAIARWIKNRSINKLVAFLKNKLAKFDDKTKVDPNDPNKTSPSDQRLIWRKIRQNMDRTGTTSTWVLFSNIVNEYRNADMLVKLNAILRQIQTTPVEKFGKEINAIKPGLWKGTKMFAIGSADGVLKLLPMMGMLTNKTNNNGGESYVTNLTKAQCDIIGKSLKSLMACLSLFLNKTLQYFQRKDDQWTMTGNQKNIAACIKNCQKTVYDIIKAANIAIGGINTDNYDEKDVEESVELSDTMAAMMSTGMALESAVFEMENITTESYDDDDFEF